MQSTCDERSTLRSTCSRNWGQPVQQDIKRAGPVSNEGSNCGVRCSRLSEDGLPDTGYYRTPCLQHGRSNREKQTENLVDASHQVRCSVVRVATYRFSETR